jgi:hypothetical protein
MEVVRCSGFGSARLASGRPGSGVGYARFEVRTFRWRVARDEERNRVRGTTPVERIALPHDFV